MDLQWLPGHTHITSYIVKGSQSFEKCCQFAKITPGTTPLDTRSNCLQFSPSAHNSMEKETPYPTAAASSVNPCAFPAASGAGLKCEV